MIKLINTYKDKSFFYKGDLTNPEIVERFDPNDRKINLYYFEEGEYFLQGMNILHDDIHIDISGNIYFEVGDTKYIIDDGYRNLLVRCGYIVYKNYDKEYFIMDALSRPEIDRMQGNMINHIIMTLDKINHEDNNFRFIDHFKSDPVYYDVDDITLDFEDLNSDWIFTVNFSSVTNLVKTNEKRKINHQPFYPYLKSMDKYGTVYVCIYALRKKSNAQDKSKYKYADDILRKMMYHMVSIDDYKYTFLDIKKRIIFNGYNNI